jgi:hypothetical protein
MFVWSDLSEINLMWYLGQIVSETRTWNLFSCRLWNLRAENLKLPNCLWNQHLQILYEIRTLATLLNLRTLFTGNCFICCSNNDCNALIMPPGWIVFIFYIDTYYLKDDFILIYLNALPLFISKMRFKFKFLNPTCTVCQDLHSH